MDATSSCALEGCEDVGEGVCAGVGDWAEPVCDGCYCGGGIIGEFDEGGGEVFTEKEIHVLFGEYRFYDYVLRRFHWSSSDVA